MEGFVFGERGQWAGHGEPEARRGIEILRYAPFTAFGVSRMTTGYFGVRCRRLREI